MASISVSIILITRHLYTVTVAGFDLQVPADFGGRTLPSTVVSKKAPPGMPLDSPDNALRKPACSCWSLLHWHGQLLHQIVNGRVDYGGSVVQPVENSRVASAAFCSAVVYCDRGPVELNFGSSSAAGF